MTSICMITDADKKLERFLIITADDFGYSSERNRGIAECFTSGSISQSSLLVNGTACQDACRLAVQLGIPVGLHLNLTEGNPVSNPDLVPSLLHKETEFLNKIHLHRALEANIINLEEIRLEIEAQIERFKNLMNGQLPEYVDGHQHVHIYPGVCTVFADVMVKYSIFNTRLPWEFGVKSCNWLENDFLEDFSQWVVDRSENVKKHFEEKQLRFANGFFGLCTMGKNMTVERLQQGILSSFRSDSGKKTSELMCHPGYRCIAEGGCGSGADEFSRSEKREHEMEILRSPEMHEFYRKYNIKLTR